MSLTKCSAPQCSRGVYSRGLCSRHYRRTRETGWKNPLGPIGDSKREQPKCHCGKPASKGPPLPGPATSDVAFLGLCADHAIVELRRRAWAGEEPGFETDNGYRTTRLHGKSHLIHRLALEHELGRSLLKHETVHHKNGQRNDNAPENLELWSTSQPAGQRVDQKIEWAVAFLREEAPELLR